MIFDFYSKRWFNLVI